MRIELTSLRTRVGRRILVLFVVCAFLPVAAVSLLSYYRVVAQLQNQSHERLRQASKTAGMALLNRLGTLSDELRVLAMLGRDEPDVARPQPPAFSRIDLISAGAPAAVSAEAAEHLRMGGALLVVRGDTVLLGRTRDRRDPRRGVLWGAVEAVALWGAEGAEGALAADQAVCVVQQPDTWLYCPSAMPATALAALGARQPQATSGEFEWTSDGAAHVAGYSSLFLKPQYLAPTWTVIASESKRSVLAPLAAFQRTFLLAILLAGFVVLLLSVSQIRKTTEPLLRLQEGTERVAAQDFTAPVAITSGDEFEGLGASFNSMADRLRRQFQEGEQLTRALRAASDSLRDSEARLRTILETAAEGIVTVDASGTITDFNRTAERIFGCGREDVIGRPVTELLAPSATPTADPVTTFRNADNGGEVVGRRRDGTTVPLEISVSEARVGERSTFTGFVRDISARKQAEAERAHLEAQLRQSQKLETIGTLAGGIAHDFNNILTAVMGYLDLGLADIPPDHPARTDLVEVQTAAQRARDLVRQILVFSRRGERQRGPVALETVVKEALKLLRASLPSTIAIRHSADPELPPVLADATQIHQVLMNLCTNAYHAMRETGGVLDVTVTLVEVGVKMSGTTPNVPPGPYVRVRVRDTGHGMDRATMERIFEPFFTTKAVGEGTGLGLSVVHGIVTSHEGAITVDSEPGRGTTLCVYLPVAAAVAAVIEAEQPLDIHGKERVLVVDDDPAIARITERALGRWGYQVAACTSSRDALELFRATPAAFDLVLTDYTMPGLTGIQLARELRELRPDVRIILVTGLGEALTNDERRAMGFREYLTKPLSIRELGAAVRRVLDHAPATES